MRRPLHTFRYLLILSLSINVQAADLPESVRKILDEHTSDLIEIMSKWPPRRGASTVITKEWLPGYVIKYGIERVRYSHKVNRVIEKHCLDLVAVPHKYVYQVKERGEPYSNRNSIVITECIDGELGIGFKLSRRQAEQLYCVAINTPHYDMHRANYILSSKDGKIYIIDTDHDAMGYSFFSLLRPFLWLMYGDSMKIRDGLIRLHPAAHFETYLSLKNTSIDCADHETHDWMTSVLQQREKDHRKLRKNAFYGSIALGIGAVAFMAKSLWKHANALRYPLGIATISLCGIGGVYFGYKWYAQTYKNKEVLEDYEDYLRIQKKREQDLEPQG